MKKTLIFTGLLISAFHVIASDTPEAKRMFESSKQKMSFKNISMIIDLETFNEKGYMKSKTIAVSYAEFDKQKKVLIEFIAPKTVTGTKIVTTDYSDQKGLIEIYTPATGRVQKIKANQRNLKIMGSKIPIGQFSSSEELNFNYTYLGKELLNGVNCHKIKMQKPRNKEYRLVFVSVNEEYLLGIKKYDTHNRLISITELSDYIYLNSSKTKVYPKKINIKNIKTGEKTNMNVRQVINISKVSPDDFTLTPTNL